MLVRRGLDDLWAVLRKWFIDWVLIKRHVGIGTGQERLLGVFWALKEMMELEEEHGGRGCFRYKPRNQDGEMLREGQPACRAGSFGGFQIGGVKRRTWRHSWQKALNARLRHLFWFWWISREPEILSSQGHNGNIALIVFSTTCCASIPSVEAGQVTTHVPDNLMRNTCFYANPNL